MSATGGKPPVGVHRTRAANLGARGPATQTGASSGGGPRPPTRSVSGAFHEGDDLRRLTADALADASAHEPRITRMMREVLMGQDAELVDLATRLKSIESAVRKIEVAAGRSGAMEQAALVAGLDDLVRYRVAASSRSYADVLERTVRRLAGAGARALPSRWRDLWSDSRYKGVNATWEIGSQLFEIQFHTRESARIAGSRRVAGLYSQARVTRGPARKRLDRELKRLWADVARPPGRWGVP